MTITIGAHQFTVAQVAKMIDHSLLRPELTEVDLQAGFSLATRYCTASVCVRPCDVSAAAEAVADTSVAVGTVVGFPHGSTTTRSNVEEARQALTEGASEIDMVINIGRLRSGQDGYVGDEIAAVTSVSHDAGAIVKVILETAYLNRDEKVRACHLAERAHAAFVKTSTGFAQSGATISDVQLMRASVGPQVQIKAAGGVRSLTALLEMAAVGATRFGATATATILDELSKDTGPGAVA